MILSYRGEVVVQYVSETLLGPWITSLSLVAFGERNVVSTRTLLTLYARLKPMPSLFSARCDENEFVIRVANPIDLIILFLVRKESTSFDAVAVSPSRSYREQSVTNCIIADSRSQNWKRCRSCSSPSKGDYRMCAVVQANGANSSLLDSHSIF